VIRAIAVALVNYECSFHHLGNNDVIVESYFMQVYSELVEDAFLF
jgi:hypothetical protein